jgi:hypothetical protein
MVYGGWGYVHGIVVTAWFFVMIVREERAHVHIYSGGESGQPFPLLTPFFTYQLANHHTQKKLPASVWPHPKFQKSTYLSALVLEALHDII